MINPKLPELFEQLPEHVFVERRYQRGETVFSQGEATGGLWFVAQGRVELQRVTEAGHQVLIHRAYQGGLFAEASLFSETYHCTAVSQDESLLIKLSRASLLRSLCENPNFALQLCAMLAGQVQSYRRLVEILSIRKAEERVYAAAAHGMLDSDIKSLAARIGLTHEAVYRALARLVEQGRLVKSGRGRYAIVQAKETLTDPKVP